MFTQCPKTKNRHRLFQLLAIFSRGRVNLLVIRYSHALLFIKGFDILT